MLGLYIRFVKIMFRLSLTERPEHKGSNSQCEILTVFSSEGIQDDESVLRSGMLIKI